MRKFENLFPRWIGAGTVLMCPFSPTVAVVEGATLPAGQGFFKLDAYDIVERPANFGATFWTGTGWSDGDD